MSPVVCAEAPLVVVQDSGGLSALPYYQAAGLTRERAGAVAPRAWEPTAHARGYREADLLPVHSARLTLGPVTPRAIRAPGLPAIFLIGDDDRSRAWLTQRIDRLRKLKAVGFVVQVGSQSALDALRVLAPGLRLAPVSGDELARRLNLQYYPALITATGIEP